MVTRFGATMYFALAGSREHAEAFVKAVVDSQAARQ